MNPRLLRLASGFKAWLFNWRSHALTLLLVAGVALGINAWQTRHIPPGRAPDFRVELAGAIGAQAISLEAWRAQHAGRAVALHFWADWCPICRAEEGSVSDVQHDWPVLTVAMRSGDAAQVARVLQQRGWPPSTPKAASRRCTASRPCRPGSCSTPRAISAMPAWATRPNSACACACGWRSTSRSVTPRT